jgi:hypothetical protein
VRQEIKNCFRRANWTFLEIKDCLGPAKLASCSLRLLGHHGPR